MKIKLIPLILAIGSGPTFAQSKKEVETMIKEVNTLRETLVMGVPEKPTLETFKAVCQPVGMRLKSKSKEFKIEARQASHKYRNPAAKATPLEMKAIQRFQENKALTEFWMEAESKQHYFHRIDVKKQCLTCHGEKNLRPDFVEKKFPDDRAYGFATGDLRGIYHVTTPLMAPKKTK